MLVCVTEDQVDSRRARAEAAADGSRCGHEEQRLSLHRPVLRSSFQRGLSVLSAKHLMFSQRVFLTQNTYFVFFQGDCWICMELMSTSFDKFYKYVYSSLDEVIPEEILGKITLAVSYFLFRPFNK